MMTETGQVVATEGDGHAWVETQRKTVCGDCVAQKGCGTSVIAKVLGRRSNRIRVINTINASPGELVVIGIEDGMLVRASFAVYAMPLILMLAGGLTGSMLGDAFHWESREGVTAVFGVSGLLSGFLWLRRYTRAIARDARHQPRLLGFATTGNSGHPVTVGDMLREYHRKI